MIQMTNIKNNTINSTNNSSFTTENVKIIGLGKAGVKIVNNLGNFPEAQWLDIAAVDTDSSSIISSKLENSFLIGEEWTNGRGCGGNVIKGERALAHKSNIQIEQFLKDSSLLVLVAGFGGGTATGGTPVIARLARKQNIPVIYVITLPFSFEGHSKREIAENQIHTLIRTSGTVIPIPNDLLYSSLPASTPFEKAFEKSNIEVARAILGISELLRYSNLISVDLCDLHNLLCRQKSECGIGIGIADKKDGGNRTHFALKKLLESPLLGGRQRIKNADALIVSLTGGEDLTIGEMKHSLENISELASEHAEIIVGANTSSLYNDRVQFTVIPINFDEASEPIIEKYPKEKREKISKSSVIKNIVKMKHEAVQLELPFENQSRGIFTSTSPTLHKGTDLDIPTFQRQRIHLDKGK